MKNFLDALAERVIVFDGAMGTSIHARNLTLDDFGGARYENCNEYLVVTRPDVISEIHAAYFEAGADVVETDTFGGTSIVLADFDLADQAYTLNRKAAELAKKVAADFATPTRQRWVAGSIGPGTKAPTIGQITYDALCSAYFEQALGLIDGGADILLVETCFDILQTKATLSSVFQAMHKAGKRLPVMAQVTIEFPMGTMLMGTEIAAALTALEPFPVDVIGMNCATGPKQMVEHVRYLCESSPRFVSCIPNAGLPETIDGQAVYKETPESLSADLLHFVRDYGVNVVGGCCGTGPAHIKAIAEAVSGLAPKVRAPQFLPSASSIYFSQPYKQDTSFLIVGERVNASGSKKARELLLADDWDGLIALAREQQREGAHVLDVNVDYVGRDGERDMRELVSRLVGNIKIPLMLDSTEWSKMEEGLKLAGGKCILNSTNFEDGEPRFSKVIELAKTYGAAVVVGTIDEDGMARTAEKKLAIARRAIEHAVNAHGMAPHDIFIDPLALPISTGIEEDRQNAAETLRALKMLKSEFPEVNTILGVSNISFGLNPVARVTLNSVFLHLAVEAGLDAAIVNASKIIPLNRIDEAAQELARQLVFDERRFDGDVCTFDPLGEFTTHYEGATSKRDKSVDAALPVEERLKRHVIDGEKIGLEAALTEALERYEPLQIINEILLDGMKVVGDLFGSGQMQLPFVLQSAEVMKAAVRQLEPLMERTEGSTKGTMVLATVKGDVHDIGKNLVDIILTNNGYRVINLGIKQPIDAILQAFQENKADAIGMSGLLVKSTVIMKDNLEIMTERGLTVPVILGGAALTRRYVEQDLRPVYDGKLFYANDAFSGLSVMDRLCGVTAPEVDVEQVSELRLRAEEVRSAAKAKTKAARAASGSSSVAVAEVRSAVATDVEIPTPPFFGSRVVADIPLADVFAFINETALFKGQWQVRQGTRSRDEYQHMLDEKIRPVFERLKADAIERRLLEPKVVYGYFPCQSEGNELVVFDEASEREVGRFSFPRQAHGKRLCLADYFAAKGSGRMDVVGMQLVTVGKGATEYAQDLFAADNYSEYLYFHGLAVETAEALAEYWHKRVREELGIAADDAPEMSKLFQQGYRGSRYSFGYPACPNLEDQEILFRFIDPSSIGVGLTEEFQLDPEQSTSALVAHHPEARYFTID